MNKVKKKIAKGKVLSSAPAGGKGIKGGVQKEQKTD